MPGPMAAPSRRAAAERVDRGLEDAGDQSTPPGVHRGDSGAVAAPEEHRQTIGPEDARRGATDSSEIRVRRPRPTRWLGRGNARPRRRRRRGARVDPVDLRAGHPRPGASIPSRRADAQPGWRATSSGCVAHRAGQVERANGPRLIPPRRVVKTAPHGPSIGGTHQPDVVGGSTIAPARRGDGEGRCVREVLRPPVSSAARSSASARPTVGRARCRPRSGPRRAPRVCTPRQCVHHSRRATRRAPGGRSASRAARAPAAHRSGTGSSDPCRAASRAAGPRQPLPRPHAPSRAAPRWHARAPQAPRPPAAPSAAGARRGHHGRRVHARARRAARSGRCVRCDSGRPEPEQQRQRRARIGFLKHATQLVCSPGGRPVQRGDRRSNALKRVAGSTEKPRRPA